MKKLINLLRWKVAQWHKKRFQKLMAKSLGGNLYYKYVKCNLNSEYGKQVHDFVKAYRSGTTHMDINSSYPSVLCHGIYPNIYVDTDSLVNQEGNKNEM